MSIRLRVWLAAGVLAGGAAVTLTMPPPEAHADVCGNVGGRRVSVSGCTDIAGAIAPWVPPPAVYAPLPEDYVAPPPPPPPIGSNVSVCANVGGRRVSVSGCT